MGTPHLYFEDFAAGDTRDLGSREVTSDDIVAFARQWDPQPTHTGEDGASLTGGLSASGWHTACMLMRAMYDGFLSDSASLGAPGIEEVRWPTPVRPGDTLSMRYTVMETRASASRPDVGFVKFLYEVETQRGETAMTMKNYSMFARRAAGDGL